MGKITAFYGTKDLGKVLEHKAVLSPYAMWLSHMYDTNVGLYQGLVKIFAEKVRQKEKEMGKEFPRQSEFEQANNLDEALADLAMVEPKLFGIDSDEIRKFKDKRRGIHVILTDYRQAGLYAAGQDGGIVEFSLPEDVVRKGLWKELTLVRKAIGLEDARRIYVDEKRIDEVSKELEARRYVMPVKDIAVPP
ncbi:hypothetical protein KY339_04735 [Candidatus Woesearchaeota archaeon]|nr:hypothetical protein [Candidatus Woesearchaeota archaeon]